jgi:hypothetical protein
LLFRHKDEPHNKLQVDLGDLQDQKEHLTANLETHLRVTVYQTRDKLAVDSEKVSLSDLHHAVKKFVYGRGFNNTHYITLEGSTVKINRFKGHDKKEKHKKEKESPHQSVTQSWGL